MSMTGCLPCFVYASRKWKHEKFNFCKLIQVEKLFKETFFYLKMADNNEVLSVKDLPKLDDHIKDEIVKDVQLKHIEVKIQF